MGTRPMHIVDKSSAKYFRTGISQSLSKKYCDNKIQGAILSWERDTWYRLRFSPNVTFSTQSSYKVYLPTNPRPNSRTFSMTSLSSSVYTATFTAIFVRKKGADFPQALTSHTRAHIHTHIHTHRLDTLAKLSCRPSGLVPQGVSKRRALVRRLADDEEGEQAQGIGHGLRGEEDEPGPGPGRDGTGGGLLREAGEPGAAGREVATTAERSGELEASRSQGHARPVRGGSLLSRRRALRVLQVYRATRPYCNRRSKRIAASPG